MQNRYPIGLFSKVKANKAIGTELCCDYSQLFRRGKVVKSGFGPQGAFVTLRSNDGRFRSLSLRKMQFAEIV